MCDDGSNCGEWKFVGECELCREIKWGVGYVFGFVEL